MSNEMMGMKVISHWSLVIKDYSVYMEKTEMRKRNIERVKFINLKKKGQENVRESNWCYIHRRRS